MLLLAFLNLTSPHSIKPVCSPDFLQLPQSSSTDPREPARLVSSHCGIHVRAERAGRKAAAFRGERGDATDGGWEYSSLIFFCLNFGIWLEAFCVCVRGTDGWEMFRKHCGSQTSDFKALSPNMTPISHGHSVETEFSEQHYSCQSHYVLQIDNSVCECRQQKEKRGTSGFIWRCD